MTREEQLEYCQVCRNHKVDFQRGVICKLTDKKADFIGECNDFEESPRLKAEMEEKWHYEDLEYRRAGFGIRLLHSFLDSFVASIILIGIGVFIYKVFPSILQHINILQLYVFYYLYIITTCSPNTVNYYW